MSLRGRRFRRWLGGPAGLLLRRGALDRLCAVGAAVHCIISG